MKNYKKMKSGVKKIMDKHDSSIRDELKLNDKTCLDITYVKEIKQDKREENLETNSNLKIITEIDESDDSDDNNSINLKSNIRLLHNVGINQLQKEIKTKVLDKKEEQKMILSNQSWEGSLSENLPTQDINLISKSMSEKEIRLLITKRINSSSKLSPNNMVTNDQNKNTSPLNTKHVGNEINKENLTTIENRSYTKPMSLFFESFQKKGSGNKENLNELQHSHSPFIEYIEVKKSEFNENGNTSFLNDDCKKPVFTRKSFKRNSDGNLRFERTYKERGSLEMNRMYSKTIIMKKKEKTQISLIPKNRENSVSIGFPQNISAHMQESRDPNSFMLREISKIEKKLLVNKKKELQEYNKKLDYIFSLLLGSKKLN
jgi:hypothetical protein